MVTTVLINTNYPMRAVTFSVYIDANINQEGSIDVRLPLLNCPQKVNVEMIVKFQILHRVTKMMLLAQKNLTLIKLNQEKMN